MADTREKLNCLTVKHQHEADNLSDAARKACGDDGTVSTFKWMHSLAAAHKEFVSELDDIACLLENGVTVQKWIPVTERLPDEECRCLVIDAAGDIEMDCYDGKGRFVLDRSGAVQHPSHWMPLPEPPKGE